MIGYPPRRQVDFGPPGDLHLCVEARFQLLHVVCRLLSFAMGIT
jgi:hypothetical protein